ncbi:MAG: hypothetical protein A3E84_00950 [Gammaproteobacteria bacterium RIFCSPHIGHO2_12_FULL_42_13]|nr:MAG: hypothetical protein A3E84_00950 [Gammaproteobacteria bacterium RIFCSPHIGHO2_12_FULL_42_13]
MDGSIMPPLRVIDTYGFYSHEIPTKKSFFQDPLAFFSQKLGIAFRLRGSYGEWQRENIHEVAFGKGLTGRLFEMDIEQFSVIRLRIKNKISEQKRYFQDNADIQQREELYYNSIVEHALKYFVSGSDWTDAMKTARKEMPLPEFKFSLTGHGHTCKIAALDMLASCYDTNNVKIHEIIDRLKGNRVENAIPRLTRGLDKIVIHANTDQWEVRGKINKYPYYDWNKATADEQFSMIAVTFGDHYIDTQGNFQAVFTINGKNRQLLDDLKTIGRLCEIYIKESKFKQWHKKICHYINNIASCKNERQERIRAVYAEKYMTNLVNSDEFTLAVDNRVPPNLTKLVNGVLDRYDTTQENTFDIESLRVI